MRGNRACLTPSYMEQIFLLYLPTQIRYPIGGKRVTCHGSKLAYSLGRTKLTSSLGRVIRSCILKWWPIFVSVGLMSKVGEHFLLEKAFIIQEKRFIIRQQHIKEEKLNSLCLQAFNLAPKIWVVRQPALR